MLALMALFSLEMQEEMFWKKVLMVDPVCRGEDGIWDGGMRLRREKSAVDWLAVRGRGMGFEVELVVLVQGLGEALTVSRTVEVEVDGGGVEGIVMACSMLLIVWAYLKMVVVVIAYDVLR